MTKRQTNQVKYFYTDFVTHEKKFTRGAFVTWERAGVLVAAGVFVALGVLVGGIGGGALWVKPATTVCEMRVESAFVSTVGGLFGGTAVLAGDPFPPHPTNKRALAKTSAVKIKVFISHPSFSKISNPYQLANRKTTHFQSIPRPHSPSHRSTLAQSPAACSFFLRSAFSLGGVEVELRLHCAPNSCRSLLTRWNIIANVFYAQIEPTSPTVVAVFRQS